MCLLSLACCCKSDDLALKKKWKFQSRLILTHDDKYMTKLKAAITNDRIPSRISLRKYDGGNGKSDEEFTR